MRFRIFKKNLKVESILNTNSRKFHFEKTVKMIFRKVLKIIFDKWSSEENFKLLLKAKISKNINILF